MGIELSNQGPRLTREALEAYAAKHRILLPPPFVEFLLENNGGSIDDAFSAPVGDGTNTAGLTFLGAIENPSNPGQRDLATRAAITHNRPAKWLTPLAEDAFGNLFAVSSRTQDLGSVWFWDHETNQSSLVNSAFDAFLASIHLRKRETQAEEEGPTITEVLKTGTLEEVARRLPAELEEDADWARSRVAKSNRLDVLLWMIDNGHSAGMLRAAAVYENLAFVNELLDRGADLEEEDEDGNTALMLAVRSDRPEIVARLLDAGADTTRKDRIDMDLLQRAKYDGAAANLALLKERLGSAPAKRTLTSPKKKVLQSAKRAALALKSSARPAVKSARPAKKSASSARKKTLKTAKSKKARR